MRPQTVAARQQGMSRPFASRQRQGEPPSKRQNIDRTRNRQDIKWIERPTQNSVERKAPNYLNGKQIDPSRPKLLTKTNNCNSRKTTKVFHFILQLVENQRFNIY